MERSQQPGSTTSAPPEAKRKKLNDKEDGRTHSEAIFSPIIEAIVPDSLIKPIIYERCVIATMADKRRLSEFIREINKALPLPTFQHLKRVRNGQVLLFPAALLASIAGGKDLLDPSSDTFRDQVKTLLLETGFSEPLLEVCSTFTIEELTAVKPQLKCQYEEVVQRWPCKFHEDKELEKLTRHENFNDQEILFHGRMMRLCFDLRQTLASECVALTFDPTRNEIVALGWTHPGPVELFNMIPWGHSVMRAIDNVAVHQGGGAWKAKGDQDLLHKGLEFARGEFRTFTDLHLQPADELKYGSYLCTGFDMYLTDEPCLMCSMAMVHSRVRRIFFRRDNVENGALGGGNKLKLHGVRELNHHYQVFRVNND